MTNKTTDWQFGDYLDKWEGLEADAIVPEGDIRQAVRDHERELLDEFCKWMEEAQDHGVQRWHYYSSRERAWTIDDFLEQREVA